jgi:hypothetical protein
VYYGSGTQTDNWSLNFGVRVDETIHTGMSIIGTGVTSDPYAYVGIGTKTPSQLLTISDPESPFLRFERSNPTRYDFEIGMNGDADLIFRGGADNIGNSLVEHMRIRGGGNVGIGTTTPNYKLDVAGNINFTGTLYQNGTIFSGSGSSQWTTSGSDIYYSTGNVGIGTSSPTAGLHVSSNGLLVESAKQDVTQQGLHLQWNRSSGGGEGWIINNIGLSHTPSTQSINFGFTDSGGTVTETMRVMKDGNVGIGTTSPSQKLHVDGALYLTSNPSNPGDTTSASFWNQANIGPTISGVAFSVETNGTSERLRILSNGYIGIGTSTPDRDFQIKYPGTTTRYISLCGGSSDNELMLGVGQSGLNRIYSRQHATPANGLTLMINLGDTVGDGITIKPGTSAQDLGIGIGTTDPKAKVHISGDYSGFGVLNSGPNKYFSADTSTTSLGYSSSGTQSLQGTSLYADDNIITARYFASHQNTTFSDMRIKKDIVDIEDDRALQTIRLIKPKQYKYIDNIINTSEPVWGFIAQEVSSVMNYSTVIMNKAIPNIFALKAYNAGILALDTTTLLTDAEGNLIKKLLIKVRGDREKDVTIKEILENGVTLEQTLQDEDLVEGEIFVYGQYVDDFHVLKKDAIFTVAVAALQEVDRRQVEDNERITELEAENEALQSEVNLLKQQMATVMQKLGL